jgi:hypothetical protein
VIYTYLVLVGIVLFALVGFQRGWLQEVATLGGLLLAWLIVLALGGLFVAGINRVVLMARFTIDDGFDSPAPGAMLETLRRMPALDPRHPDVVLGILFVGLATAAFLAAQRFAPPASSGAARALGVLVGIANGYLVCYLALRFLVPAARLGFDLPNLPTSGATTLGQYLPTLLLVGVLVTIGLALVSSKRIGGKSSGRISPSRMKG